MRLRKRYPEKRMQTSKAGVSDAFRNVRIDPDQEHNYCETVGDLIIIDFRLTFAWSAAVIWVNKCGGNRTKGRAGLLMRMLRFLEFKGGWSHATKHIPGVQNVLADGISQWPRSELGCKAREQPNTED